MKKTKIVHLISSLKIGGAESLLPDLIEGLGFEQFEHEVFYFHAGPNVKRLELLSVPVQQIQGLFFLYDPVFFWRLWRAIWVSKPTVMHCALWAANLFGRCIGYLQKIPVVCVVHLGVDLDGALRNFLDRFTFRLSTRVVAVSNVVADSIHTKKGWISPDAVTTILNGIDADAIVTRAQQNSKKREEIGLPDDAIVIGCVGRFVERKNISLLLHSFADLSIRYPKLYVVLVGTGPQEEMLRSLADTLGIRERTIFVIGQSAYGYYPLFDIFVLCSRQEGLSIALLEAMSCGLPCIITTENEKHELIMSQRNGVIVKSGDQKALTVALEKMATEVNLRAVLGANARACVDKEFRLDRMIDAYRNVFKSLENS